MELGCCHKYSCPPCDCYSIEVFSNLENEVTCARKREPTHALSVELKQILHMI
jgi:hypothetical protein